MFPTSKMIKQEARAALAKVWPQAIALVFLLLAMFFLPFLLFQLGDVILNGYLYSVFYPVLLVAEATYMLFIMMPLIYGSMRWIWGITDTADMPFSVVFIAFGDKAEYGRAIKIGWAFWWRIMLASLPSIVATIVAEFGLEIFSSIIDTEVAADLIVSAGSYISTLLALGIVLRMFPLIFMTINHPYRHIRENVAESKVISKTYSALFQRQFLSLLGWLVLSFFIIPIIYTIPFILTCYAVLVRHAINNYVNRKK